MHFHPVLLAVCPLLVAICVIFYLYFTSSPSANPFKCTFNIYPNSDRFLPATRHPQARKPYLMWMVDVTSLIYSQLHFLPPLHFYSTHSSQINYFNDKIKTCQPSLNSLMTFHCIKIKSSILILTYKTQHYPDIGSISKLIV